MTFVVLICTCKTAGPAEDGRTGAEGLRSGFQAGLQTSGRVDADWRAALGAADEREVDARIEGLDNLPVVSAPAT